MCKFFPRIEGIYPPLLEETFPCNYLGTVVERYATKTYADFLHPMNELYCMLHQRYLGGKLRCRGIPDVEEQIDSIRYLNKKLSERYDIYTYRGGFKSPIVAVLNKHGVTIQLRYLALGCDKVDLTELLKDTEIEWRCVYPGRSMVRKFDQYKRSVKLLFMDIDSFKKQVGVIYPDFDALEYTSEKRGDIVQYE